MDPRLTTLLWGLALACLGMQALWFVARAVRNAGLVDFGWAATLAGLAILAALRGTGSDAQRLLAGLLGGIWGLRLAALLLFDRVLGREEDGRYRAMRAHFGTRADLHFLWFFQAQALLAVLLAWPSVALAQAPIEGLAPLQIAGLVLFATAKTGETVADLQLARFRRDPANRGRTCRSGLWRLSRHPNDFFEWLIWCAFALCATPAPGGHWAWLCPAAMFVFVTKITGIPHTEAQALRSRGEDYRSYQRTTNAFFPGPPRPDPQASPR